MIVQMTVTNYSVRDNEIVETTTTADIELEIRESVGEQWLCFARGPQSMPLDRVPEAIERGGWYANAGAPPVYCEPCPSYRGARPCAADCGCGSDADVRGGWGGHVYPQEFISADELRKALDQVAVSA